jgi:hypothetical protein
MQGALNRMSGRSTGILRQVALLSVVTLAQILPASSQPRPEASIQDEIVEVRFGTVTYAVPRNYLAGVTEPKDGNAYAAFTIQVLLPDFSPRTPENAAQFEQLGWHDLLRALFEYGRHPRRPEELVADYLKDAGLSSDDFQLVGSGYKFYQSENTVPHEMFTKETQNGLLFFTCEDKKYSIPSPSCTVNEPFRENIGVIYHFDRQYMDKAAEIDTRLHSLLNGFLKK